MTFQEDERQYGRDLQEMTEAQLAAEQRIHAFKCTLNEMMEAEAKQDALLRQAIEDIRKALDGLGRNT
jgi:hypothetical protein